MNHGAMIAIHAAAAAAKARSDVLDAFRVRGATAPDRARPLYDLGLALDNAALREFFAAGILRGVDARGLRRRGVRTGPGCTHIAECVGGSPKGRGATGPGGHLPRGGPARVSGLPGCGRAGP